MSCVLGGGLARFLIKTPNIASRREIISCARRSRAALTPSQLHSSMVRMRSVFKLKRKRGRRDWVLSVISALMLIGEGHDRRSRWWQPAKMAGLCRGAVGRRGARFEELAHAAEFVVAGGEQFVVRLAHQFAERFDEVHFEPGGHLVVVAVGGAERFVDHVVDHAELLQVAGSELEGAGRVGGEVVALPEDAGAAFGADHP